MNNRINQIAKQAHESCFDNPYVPNFSSERFNKKLAELIIKETLSVALYGDEFEQARNNVKQLFGVSQ